MGFEPGRSDLCLITFEAIVWRKVSRMQTRRQGGEGERSPRGGTTEAIKPRSTVPGWVEFPSEPDRHTFSEETNCRSKQVGVNKESSWAALTSDKMKKGAAV